MPKNPLQGRRRCWPTCRATRTGWRVSNSRLLAMDERGVTFRWKDYRVKDGAKGKARHKTMTLSADEFMRRFLLHVLPASFHRIRHYGLLANAGRKANLVLARTLLGQPSALPAVNESTDNHIERDKPSFVCAHCGAAMTVLQTYTRGQSIRAPPEHPSAP